MAATSINEASSVSEGRATSQGCATCPRRFECPQYMELVGLAATVRFLYQSLRKVVGPAFLPLAEGKHEADEA